MEARKAGIRRGTAGAMRTSTSSVATLCLIVSSLVWLDASLAALQAAGDRHSDTRAESVGLCQATPEQRREHSTARYHDESPSPGIEAFLAEWHRDLSLEETRRFEPLRPLGRGKQGSVVVAKDLATEKLVAIKQVKDAFGKTPTHGHRILPGGILRELSLLRLFNASDFTTDILHAFLPKADEKHNFTTVYFAMDLMDMPLVNKDLSSRVMELPPQNTKIMFFHALRALAAMHSVGIFHRDMSVANIMGNVDCTFKVIDFGMSGPELPHPNSGKGPREIEKRFSKSYGISANRPPELFFDSGEKWRASYDVWMLGCTFLRLMADNQPIICGINPTQMNRLPNKDQSVKKIIKVLGMPSKDTLQKYRHQARHYFLKHKPKLPSTPTGLSAEYPRADKELLNFIQRMLNSDPDRRPSVATLLQDPLFAGMGSSGDALLKSIDTKKSPNKVASPADVSDVLEVMSSPEAFDNIRGIRHNRKMVYQEILNNYGHSPDISK